MRSKIFIVGFVIGLALYTGYIPDPLNSFAAFLMAGLIPGTHIMLGILPMFVVCTVIVIGIFKYTTHIRLVFLEHTAKTITAEKIKREFTNAHATSNNTRDRGVIAAPSVHTIN